MKNKNLLLITLISDRTEFTKALKRLVDSGNYHRLLDFIYSNAAPSDREKGFVEACRCGNITAARILLNRWTDCSRTALKASRTSNPYALAIESGKEKLIDLVFESCRLPQPYTFSRYEFERISTDPDRFDGGDLESEPFMIACRAAILKDRFDILRRIPNFAQFSSSSVGQFVQWCFDAAVHWKKTAVVTGIIRSDWRKHLTRSGHSGFILIAGIAMSDEKLVSIALSATRRSSVLRQTCLWEGVSLNGFGMLETAQNAIHRRTFEALDPSMADRRFRVENWSAAAIAAMISSDEVALIVAKHYGINRRNGEFPSPLQAAILKGDSFRVKLLRKNGADPKLKFAGKDCFQLVEAIGRTPTALLAALE